MKPEILAIHGLTTEKELEFLQELCEGLPAGMVLEIGTFNGRSTAALCEAVGHERVVSFDNYKMKHHGENTKWVSRANLDRLGMHPLLCEGDSPLKKTLIDFTLPEIALVFLDGHHHPETVTNELLAYTPMMSSGGVAAMHDFGREEYPGYSEAIEEFFDDDSWVQAGITESLIAFRKM